MTIDPQNTENRLNRHADILGDDGPSQGELTAAEAREFHAGKIIAQLKRNHVITERDTMFREQLNRLFDFGPDGRRSHSPVLYTRGTETRGIIFIEGSGGGKSTTILEALENFAPLRHNPETNMPRYLEVTVQNPATLRSVGCQILGAMGFDHVSARVTVPEIWSQVRLGCRVRGISLIWLDEAQDLFSTTGKRADDTISAETDRIFKMLKSLMQGDNPVVVVLSGTGRLGTIASADPQIYRRFYRIQPRPLASGSDNDLIDALISNYAEEAGLACLTDDDLTNRVLYAGRYRFGRCLELIIDAIRCALREGDLRVDISHFAAAFGANEGCDLDQNIFAVTNWTEIYLDDDDDLRVLADEANDREHIGRTGKKPRRKGHD